MQDYKLNTIEEALEEIKKGNFVIVVDDADRENEGDLIAAAETITPEGINFLETHARGLICAPITKERAEELDLPMMVSNNTSIHATPFTVSIDLLTNGCTTGISAYDRAQTVKALANKDTKPEEFGRPGHIFPLRAQTKGVLRRAGHTEATIDLARLAGLYPAGVLAEIKNEDGSMARMPKLMEMAKQFDLKIISVADLIKYRLQTESLVERGEEVHLPTQYGDFMMIPFLQKATKKVHVALIKGKWEQGEPILVRVHSSCVTGDIFGSYRCECGEQLHKSMEMIEKEGKGVVVYLNQEGRGIGLMAKAEAYKLQEEGLDTVDANLHLGYKADERDYGVGAQILRNLGVTKMRLMTNNPKKRIGLESFGLEVAENVSIEIVPNKYNLFYMKTKKDRMGHLLKNIK
ncbi:MAG: bifunctional 3,4-dihydroxy-2-butanone-4-phosphate synthase/GTP cyclohydrolase II [Dysgonamonadaceae bacterium]|nr:bifunctional 3,4-dihydroxy-2-butanone-4-phosphate synthase/GTP cyclohydrolase II [Dysgonamonadaceae bacterium]MDD3308606.1 bifunctional 3,4-dihydroxy-2-butanone-4-phosphate synthase/GTP cyclohydrolase II [Dysgonamonadaceae bacterium]MDD3900723.1 bifunctional 3,4-dihydroxy-2-butanone-4-phosphate synthase/GTP cyclohydrolase II [Dysgonamonadaceae bacterium]MDD4398287.1 bifunctional 3,4-dihydroxy-2-butanone-4-phosphate synthase/GTP cyclohydrolase II [Dysgonamonadaceae bacterium]MEA5080661.1 bifu